MEAKSEPIFIRLAHCVFPVFGLNNGGLFSRHKWWVSIIRGDGLVFTVVKMEKNPDTPLNFLVNVSHDSWHLNHHVPGSCLISLCIYNSLVSASQGNYKFRKYKISYLNSSDHILSMIIPPVFHRGKKKIRSYFKYINIPLMWLLVKLSFKL